MQVFQAFQNVLKRGFSLVCFEFVLPLKSYQVKELYNSEKPRTCKSYIWAKEMILRNITLF